MKYRDFEDWLADFKKYNQGGVVHREYMTSEGYNLGYWVHNVRSGRYKLTDEQKERLDEAGFIWDPRSIKVCKVKARRYQIRSFEDWLEDFVKYSTDGDVPQRYVTPEGYRLGVWVSTIRQSMLTLSNDKIKRLEAVGFKWRVRATPKKRSFEDWLEDYKLYNVNGYVSLNFITPAGYRLGAWVKNVRYSRYGLTQKQRKLLSKAGFIWRNERYRPNNRSFEEWLEDFRRYNVNGNVAANYVTPDNQKLGNWVSNVRNGGYRLTEEQKKRLTDAGFVWQAKRGRPRKQVV